LATQVHLTPIGPDLDLGSVGIGKERLEFTIVWFDPNPASEGADQGIVNAPIGEQICYLEPPPHEGDGDGDGADVLGAVAPERIVVDAMDP